MQRPFISYYLIFEGIQRIYIKYGIEDALYKNFISSLQNQLSSALWISQTSTANLSHIHERSIKCCSFYSWVLWKSVSPNNLAAMKYLWESYGFSCSKLSLQMRWQWRTSSHHPKTLQPVALRYTKWASFMSAYFSFQPTCFIYFLFF
jgi:hypothetical protein